MLRRLYTIWFYILLPFAFLRLLWRSRKLPDYRKRWGERLAIFTMPEEYKGSLWIHAVSVGEFIAALPLINSLKKNYPNNKIVVTTLTPTGSQRVQDTLGDQVFHVYLPYDIPCIISKFLKKIQPRIAIIMETELWPNMLYFCHERKIPILLANARLSKRSKSNYAKFRPIVKNMMEEITIIAAQSDLDAKRFMQLGAMHNKIQVVGNIKFDTKVSDDIPELAHELRKQLGEKRPVWIAASTHSGEEEQILQALKQIKKHIPTSLLILVPRHPDRFSEVYTLCKQHNYHVLRRSDKNIDYSNMDIYLGNTMGEMMLMYCASDVAFVGGSLVGVGGHNLLEPAMFCLPIITGPNLFNFAKIAELLEQAKALTIINSAKQLSEQVVKFFMNKELRHRDGNSAYQVVISNRGSLNKHLTIIRQLLQHDNN